MGLPSYILMFFILAVLLTVVVAVYFLIYRRNINKALSAKDTQLKQMAPPHKVAIVLSVVFLMINVFVAVVFLKHPADPVIDSGQALSDKWAAECRTVLEDIQSTEYYHIRESGVLDFNGKEFVDFDTDYVRFEDYRVRVSCDESGAYTGTFCFGDNCYEAASVDPDHLWDSVEMSENRISDPWLYSFDMTSNKTEAVSKYDTGGGYCIRLMVYAPYSFREIETENYFVDFCFDEEGNFKSAGLFVNIIESADGYQQAKSLMVHMIVQNTSAEDVFNIIRDYAGNLEQEMNVNLEAETGK